MTIGLSLILRVAGLICLLCAAVGVSVRRLNLQAAGLFLWFASALWDAIRSSIHVASPLSGEKITKSLDSTNWEIAQDRWHWRTGCETLRCAWWDRPGHDERIPRCGCKRPFPVTSESVARARAHGRP